MYLIYYLTQPIVTQTFSPGLSTSVLLHLVYLWIDLVPGVYWNTVPACVLCGMELNLPITLLYLLPVKKIEGRGEKDDRG